MNILYVLFTYQRPRILAEMMRTLLNNNETRPDRFLIADDGSDTNLKNSLYQFHIENRDTIPIDFFSFSQNNGLGYQWELCLNYAKIYDPQYLFWLEQDYIFRKNGIDEALEILKLKPLTCAVSLFSNPDYYNGKQNHFFSELMIDLFKSDLAKREFLHKPFYIDTKFGKIQIQLTTNACGCCVMNWSRIRDLLDKYPEMWEKVFLRSCNVGNEKERKFASDGHLTSGTSFYWYKDMEDRIKNGLEVDYNVMAPWLDICDYSVGNHINGGKFSLNGYIIPEMSSFVSSPKWVFQNSKEYDNFERTK